MICGYLSHIMVWHMYYPTLVGFIKILIMLNTILFYINVDFYKLVACLKIKLIMFLRFNGEIYNTRLDRLCKLVFLMLAH